MNPIYHHDPEFHHIAELPVTAYLRRELKDPRVITWWFDDVDDTLPDKPIELKVWVVSLCNFKGKPKFGDEMIDIGYLGSGEGEGPWCSKENAAAILYKVTNVISRAKAKQLVMENHRSQLRGMNEMAARQLETRTRIFHNIKARHGEPAAIRYARADAPELVSGGPWSIMGAG